MSLRARGSGKWEMALQGWIPVLMSCNRGLWDYRSQPPRYTVTYTVTEMNLKQLETGSRTVCDSARCIAKDEKCT